MGSSVRVPIYSCSWLPQSFLRLLMRFPSPLQRRIGIFHRLLRMLVPCLVVFFPVVDSGCPVCVRRELVEFGCSLVRANWHVGLLSMFCPPRGSLHSTLLCRADAWNCRHNAIGKRQFQRSGRVRRTEAQLGSRRLPGE